ncbi:hypothetical protein J3F83DRAFT_745510 [Trichoderma novae-zelandiae]
MVTGSLVWRWLGWLSVSVSVLASRFRFPASPPGRPSLPLTLFLCACFGIRRCFAGAPASGGQWEEEGGRREARPDSASLWAWGQGGP